MKCSPLFSIKNNYNFFLIGLLFTYVAPLAFVLLLTMLKEAYDDLKRYWKDKEANSTNYRYALKNIKISNEIEYFIEIN